MRNHKKIFALGFFDGVHLGHQALLRECVRLAAEQDAEPAAITFDRHPKALFDPQPPALINGTGDRETLLRSFGIRQIHCLPVTPEVMGQHWQRFLDSLLEEDAVGFVCGDDFRFGSRGEGTPEKLRKFCQERQIPCVIVPEQTLDGLRVSSTHIRCCIQQGKVETAACFLGHPHILSGEVVPGRHLGRTIGVPTANIRIPEGVVVPKCGVYACRCHGEDGSWIAVTNVGSRPTVGGHQIRAESWILDFEGDLYGKRITLEFCHFLRPEQKFESLEELKEQIRRDVGEAVRLLKNPDKKV